VSVCGRLIVKGGSRVGDIRCNLPEGHGGAHQAVPGPPEQDAVHREVQRLAQERADPSEADGAGDLAAAVARCAAALERIADAAEAIRLSLATLEPAVELRDGAGAELAAALEDGGG
jgi:hypothetical protein